MNEYIKIPNIFLRYTSGPNKNRLIEGKMSTPEIEYLSNDEWIWTEKVDGTNIRVIWDGYRVSFGARSEKSEIPVFLQEKLEELFGGDAREELFEQKFGNKTVILYGEGFGGKIQKHGDLYGDTDFILFDVVVGGYWLNRENVEDVAKTFDIKVVPVVGYGSLPQAVEFVRTHPKSMLRDYEMEGVVARPKVQLFDKKGNPIIVKIKCKDLVKFGEMEWTM